MLWLLDCFVARAPRNDGWVAADPIASVVIGRRLTPSFCAISSCSYPATTNSQTVSRRAALAGRCFCARARRRPRSGWESSRTSLVVTPRLRRPAGTAGLSEDRTIDSLFQKEISRQIRAPSVRTALRPGKRDAYNSRSHPVMDGLRPGHPRRPMAPQSPILSAPCRLSTWAACKPNHVDGRDKPGHDGKWHGKQDLTSLFLVSAATRLPSARNVTCATSDRPKPIYNISHGRRRPCSAPCWPRARTPRARGFFCALVVRSPRLRFPAFAGMTRCWLGRA